MGKPRNNKKTYVTMVQEVRRCTPPKKTNMAMEKQAFEDVSPIKNCDFPLPC